MFTCYVRLFETPWTEAHQASLSMGFSRQEYWSGLPFPSLRGLPNPVIKPGSPALAGGFFTVEPPGKPMNVHILALFPHLCFLPWLFLSSSTLYPKHPCLSLGWKLHLKCAVFFLPYSKAYITLKLLFMEPSEFLIMLELFLFLNPYLLCQVT